MRYVAVVRVRASRCYVGALLASTAATWKPDVGEGRMSPLRGHRRGQVGSKVAVRQCVLVTSGA